MSARETQKKARTTTAFSWGARTSSALFAGATFALVSLSGHAATIFSDDF